MENHVCKSLEITFQIQKTQIFIGDLHVYRWSTFSLPVWYKWIVVERREQNSGLGSGIGTVAPEYIDELIWLFVLRSKKMNNNFSIYWLEMKRLTNWAALYYCLSGELIWLKWMEIVSLCLKFDLYYGVKVDNQLVVLIFPLKKCLLASWEPNFVTPLFLFKYTSPLVSSLSLSKIVEIHKAQMYGPWAIADFEEPSPIWARMWMQLNRPGPN